MTMAGSRTTMGAAGRVRQDATDRGDQILLLVTVAGLAVGAVLHLDGEPGIRPRRVGGDHGCRGPGGLVGHRRRPAPPAGRRCDHPPGPCGHVGVIVPADFVISRQVLRGVDAGAGRTTRAELAALRASAEHDGVERVS